MWRGPGRGFEQAPSPIGYGVPQKDAKDAKEDRSGWDMLTAEMKQYEYAIGEGGRTSYAAPAGYHDNCVMALALANHGRCESESAGTMVRLLVRGGGVAWCDGVEAGEGSGRVGCTARVRFGEFASLPCTTMLACLMDSLA